MEEFFIQSKNPSIVWIMAKFIEDKIGGQYYSTDYIEYERILKTNKLTVLKDIISEYNGGPMGFQLHLYDYLEQGVPVLRTKDMKELTIILDDPIFISQEKHNELKGSKTYPRDIIISKTGQIGVVAVVPKTLKEANLNQALCNIRVKEGIIDNYFLAIFLNSKYGQYQFIRQGEGKAVQNGLTKDEILDLQIPVISPEIQKYIGDKVRKAEELREEAKKLKKEAEEISESELGLESLKYYVEKESKKKYAWVQNIRLEDRIDSDFYKSVYNYLNKLDNLSRLENFYKISKKKINKNLKGQIKYIDLSSVNNIIEPNEYNINELPSRAQFLVRGGDLIISALKGSKKIAIVPEHLKGSVCSTGFVVINSTSYLTTEYLYLIFTNELFNMQIDRYSTGSIMSGANLDDFNKMYIPVLSDKQVIYDITHNVEQYFRLLYQSKQLIQEAKQDVEDLIEGNFDMSKVKANN